MFFWINRSYEDILAQYSLKDSWRPQCKCDLFRRCTKSRKDNVLPKHDLFRDKVQHRVKAMLQDNPLSCWLLQKPLRQNQCLTHSPSLHNSQQPHQARMLLPDEIRCSLMKPFPQIVENYFFRNSLNLSRTQLIKPALCIFCPSFLNIRFTMIMAFQQVIYYQRPIFNRQWNCFSYQFLSRFTKNANSKQRMMLLISDANSESLFLQTHLKKWLYFKVFL